MIIMSSYYNEVTGNLHPGDIAKAEDINHIQNNIKDSLKALVNDHHEFQSYILGGRENDFILTPASKTLGRYLDTYSVPTDSDLLGLSLREYNYKQPIAKTKSSLYSIVCKLGNNTEHDVPVTCELQDDAGNVIRSDTVILKANVDKAEYEFLFDLKNEPTAMGLDMEAIKKEDGRQIPPDTREKGSYKESVQFSPSDKTPGFTVGVNQLYIVLKAIQIQINDLDMYGREFKEELDSNSFLVYVDRNGNYGALGGMYLQQGRTNELYVKTQYALYFKDVYSTDINYICTGGQAIIGGEKVICLDSHVTISGASEYGNVLTLVYMDASGHLRTSNSKASINNTSTKLEDWEREDSEPLPPEYLLIAKVLVYADVSREPLLIQDDTTQETRPRSHHERLRRLEKHVDWVEDKAVPPRLKYTLTGDDWVDNEGDESLMAAMYKNASKDNDADKVSYYMTIDEKGHLIVKSTESEVTVANVTLMNDEKSADTTKIIPTELQPDVEKTTTKTTTTTTGGTTTDTTSTQGSAQVIGSISGRVESDSEGKQILQRIQDAMNNGSTAVEAANKYGMKYKTLINAKNNTDSSTTNNGTAETVSETEIIVKTAIDSDVTTSQTDSIFKNYDEDDLRRLNRIAEMKNMKLESKTGTLTLKNKAATNTLAITDEEAKETKFNPWDDSAENRPKNKDVTPTSRQYTVTARKDGANDWDSEFPAMTFFTNAKYNLTGLTIPIVKFENCSGIKFYIWRRQGPNDKRNTVWLEKQLYESKTFSLENARTVDKYQYIDEGFTIEFDNGGLNLDKGQYVIIALPIPKEGQGSCWVDTYKPENSKDFCIRYYGAANASHFELKERYQEIWYNAATATGSKTSYEKEGSFVSGTVTLKEDSAPIAKIRTSIGKNEIPKGCSITIYGDTGGGYQKLNTDSQELDDSSKTKKEGEESKDDGNETIMKGNRMSFKWKVVFKGDEENTPKIEYDEEKKYAIQFTLVHESPAVGNSSAAFAIDKNMCITSKALDGDGILREYLGDPYFDLDDNRFSNFEFARVWAKKQNNPNLVIDVSGSDVTQSIDDKDGKAHKFSAYSLHYADLTLHDFAKESVDYSNYDTQLEEDEHNMRLKLDTENSYNDNDIQLFDMTKFKAITDETNAIKFSDDKKECTIPNNYNPGENVLLYRLRLDNPIDLTQYTGIKIALRMKKASANSSIKGLAVYLSSQYEETVPHDSLNDPKNVLVGSQALINSISKSTTYNELVSKYKDKIIKIGDGDDGGLKANTTQYYQYIAHYDESTNSLVYDLTLLHDIKNYYIYRLGKIIPESNNDKIVYQEIEIDQDSTNLKYVKEIGLIYYGEEISKAEVTSVTSNSTGETTSETTVTDSTTTTTSTPSNVVNNITFSLEEFKAIEHDYYPVFNPSENHEMVLYDPTMKLMDNPYTIRNNGKVEITADTYGPLGFSGTVPKSLTPAVMQIHLHPQDISGTGQTLCYFQNYFATHGYKHIGIQIAADVYLPKYSLRVNLCSDYQAKKVVDYVDIPTLNYIYVANKQGTIPLTQVFKKIDALDADIKSISISTTSNFKEYANKILGTPTDSNDDKNYKKYINVFIGKIVLYKARTIPMFHKKMRFKFYDKNSSNMSASKDSKGVTDIMIRKIGAVLDYR